MNRTTLRPGRSKLLVVFAAAAALAVSFAVSPAMAGTSGQASWTDGCDAGVFSSVDSLATGLRWRVAVPACMSLRSARRMTDVPAQPGHGNNLPA